MQKRYILILIILALSGTVFFGYMYYMRFHLPQQNKTYQADAKTAYDTFVSGDYATSIESLPALIAQAPNKSEVGRLKILLGVSYWVRDQSGDRTQAIKTLKEVVNDYSIPATWRAQALNSIARFVNDSSLSFYQVHFSEAPYNAFVPAEGTEAQKVSAAYLALLKYSDDTYPTSWAEYAIAHHYGYLSVSNNIGTATPSEIAQLIEKYIKDGDTRKDQSIYSPSVLLSGYLYRALAMTGSAITLEYKNFPITEVEASYQQVLLVGDTFNQATNPVLHEIVMKTRFYYAYFVLNSTGDIQQVRTILQPFDTAGNETGSHMSWTWFESLKSLPDNSFNKNIAQKLAESSVEFKDFLLQLGVL